MKGYLESHRIRKLHIGCGENILRDWLNTDIKQDDKIIYLDARRELPFEDFTFHYIFSEHFIEHLEYHEGVYFFNECFRILKPGGKIRIATPNLQFLIEIYNPEKTELQKRYITWATDSFLSSSGVYQDTLVINNYFKDWDHKFIYDFKTLRDALSKIGFTTIERCSVGESNDKNLRGIEYHGKIIPEEFNKLETMVIEAIKQN